MDDSQKERKTKPIIRVCLKCQKPYSSGQKGCENCGCELAEECPGCGESFDKSFGGINPRRRVRYCPNCLEEVLEPFAFILRKLDSNKER